RCGAVRQVLTDDSPFEIAQDIDALTDAIHRAHAQAVRRVAELETAAIETNLFDNSAGGVVAKVVNPAELIDDTLQPAGFSAPDEFHELPVPIDRFQEPVTGAVDIRLDAPDFVLAADQVPSGIIGILHTSAVWKHDRRQPAEYIVVVGRHM